MATKLNHGLKFELFTKTNNMNQPILLFVLLFLVLPIQAQYKLQDTEKAAEFQNKEAIAEIIHEAEALFLEKVNEYRKSKKSKEIKFRKEAQLMALNHCIWMRHHNKLTHSQKKESAFFSGSSLLKRLAFVDEHSRLELASENVAELNLTKQELENTTALAAFLAQSFFDLWKNSASHRENMLDKEVKFHGVSILQKGKQFFATHVFLG